MKVHTFECTGEAYDASQCSEEIESGDVLIATEDQAAGFLMDAWPVAVTTKRGVFHTIADGKVIEDIDGGKWQASWKAATEEAKRQGWELR